MAKSPASKTAQRSSKRKIITLVAVSADGFIARPNGSVEWLDRPRPKGDYGMGEFYKSIDTILLGRKTYDVALGFLRDGIVASVFDPKVKNYVFTRTLKSADALPDVEFVRGPVKPFATRLRSEKGKNIWMMGGGELIASFLDAGEIDEFIISIIPTFIGEGIPLIAPRHRTIPLRLLSSRTHPDGVVTLHYAVKR